MKLGQGIYLDICNTFFSPFHLGPKSEQQWLSSVGISRTIQSFHSKMFVLFHRKENMKQITRSEKWTFMFLIYKGALEGKRVSLFAKCELRPDRRGWIFCWLKSFIISRKKNFYQWFVKSSHHVKGLTFKHHIGLRGDQCHESKQIFLNNKTKISIVTFVPKFRLKLFCFTGIYLHLQAFTNFLFQLLIEK